MGWLVSPRQRKSDSLWELTAETADGEELWGSECTHDSAISAIRCRTCQHAMAKLTGFPLPYAPRRTEDTSGS